MISAALLATAMTANSAVVLSGGGGLLQTDHAPYVGDTVTIGRALGNTTDRADDTTPVLALRQGLWQRRAASEYALGVELTERWWSIWADSRSPVAASASHRIDRSVIAFDAALRVAFPSPTERVRLLLGLGPALYWIGTRQRGWFGDQDAIDVRVGLRGSGAVRFQLSSTFALTFDLSLEWFRVPQRTVLLDDGGRSVPLMLGAQLEVWL